MSKVLVVDDEKLIVKGIKFSLEQDGMEVDCAYDGEEALEYARNTEYDIVILDLMLPKIDGLSVCQQIREFSDMPIIMLTAKGEDMDKIMGLEYGADDYITNLKDLLKQSKNCGTEGKACVLRLGYGIGWRFITGAWAESLGNFDSVIVPKARPNNEHYSDYDFPKSRRLDEGNDVFGFVKLTIKD